MKKGIRFLMAGLLCLGLFPAVVGAQATFDQGALIKPIDKPVKLVFIPKVVHPWYDVVRAGAEKAAAEFKERGITVEVRFDAPPVADISEHLKKIEANISARPDGLAIACLDPATNTQLINDAVNAGLNVITFDTDAPQSLRPLYVGHANNFQDGYDLGEYLAKAIGGKGKVGILSGSLTAPNHVERVNGFKKAMENYKDIQIVFEQPDNDDLQKAVDLTESALQANPDLNGIFCCNASNPIGAAQAIKNAGKVGQVHIVGMDDLPETLQFIKDGVIDVVKAQRQWDIGYWSVVYMVAKVQGHTIPKEHATGSQFLTKDDLK
ncbi:ABC transporter, periplasmic sugar binding protein [Candidatus Moduliflexus flocculans]|uniref:ABC transporter, periplasmic sugar binding protein n=1 Tax=Candidatus Moduliflexus flocculans TaxID=1499966 RepID=A0A0S6VZX0_9BACT|nr:ABC transporter, periplasmic sugar binding protein [Candidatus Moduliflexus flocculans]